MHMHACVYACACVRVISGLSMHYGFSLTHYTRISYILLKSPYLCHVGVQIFVLFASDVAQSRANDRAI